MNRIPFTVNGRTYAPPREPVVVICVDGSEPAYHEQALAAGRMPWLAGLLQRGVASSWPALCAMPALTNPNNLSIATGQPPRVHGISGNYVLDPESGAEVLMNDARFLRVPTIFAAASEAGYEVAVVTAKDKLRRLLGAGLVSTGRSIDGSGQVVEAAHRGVCFSAEHADSATPEVNGISDVLDLVGRPLPEVYSADLSEFVLAAGVEILSGHRPDLVYLSLTDYIQHKHAPGSDIANDFYAMLDGWARQLDELGAVVVITADHGMSAKTDESGLPRVIFVEEEVNRVLTGSRAQVVLPITDPYTVHHGALGSFASVYLPAGADAALVERSLASLDGVQAVHTRADAAERYALPADRIGDLVVLAEKGYALGKHPAWHDLSGLDAPLRSHGALGELRIPFIVNRPLPRPADLPTEHLGDLGEGANPCVQNYDAFWIATTYVTQAARSAPDA